MSIATYAQKRQRIVDELRYASGTVGLDKDTSNLFRDRSDKPQKKLDVRDFNSVLGVAPGEGWVEVEGMTTYADLVDATLPHGVMPAVVPQLKSITVGGAVSGIGIESSSFKYGLPHETVLEMDVLLSNGQVITCTPDNEHQDLFFGIPNSYGTLGYILRLKVLTIPVKRYVKLNHIRHYNAEAFFRDLDQHRSDADFIDGVVFGPKELYLTLGCFTEQAPEFSDYTYEHIYYQSIRKKKTDYLNIKDYIWRWDTDWFWCSKNLYAQHPLIRKLFGRNRLNSVTYTKIMRWNSRWGVTKTLNRLLGNHPESVIQDVDIPIENGPAFLDFFHREIGITPIWICPIHAYDHNASFDLYPLDPNKVYINFGFWDVLKSREKHPEGHFNCKIEAKVSELGGIKSLYSDAYYSADAFWRIYNKPRYDALKTKYDPQGVFKDLYRKTVMHG